MWRRIAWVGLYLAVSLGIFLVWARVVRTELLVSEEGKPPARKFNSLLQQIDGKAGAPFVYRRLIADTAPVLARVVPSAVWEAFTNFVQSESSLARPIRKLFDTLGWPTERYPDLVMGYLLIWLSVLGFLLAMRWLLRLAYTGPTWLAHVAALFTGVMLLGGSDATWNSYPYDIPHVFVFSLALIGILTGGWWMLPIFAIACWSKETSVLLIPAYAWVHLRDWRNWRHWLVLAAMVAIWAGLYLLVRYRFPLGAGEGWSVPGRNIRFLLMQSIFGLWWTLPALVILVRVWLLRKSLPRHTLTLLAAMAAVLIVASFFKGWIEERRQYFELVPLASVVAVRWVLAELGLETLATARTWPIDRDRV